MYIPIDQEVSRQGREENRRMLGLAAAAFTGTGYAMGDGV
jgi:hypothetical protein